MRRSREAKAETREAIVAQASRLFRQRGVEGTSVGDVMEAAERTHGGFYRHFETKEALLVAALNSAFADMAASFARAAAHAPPDKVAAGFLAFYLSPERIRDMTNGCPIATLAGDVARSSPAVKTEFGADVRAAIEGLAKALDGPEAERSEKAARIFALAAGALMMARASDPQTAEFILQAARKGAQDVATGQDA